MKSKLLPRRWIVPSSSLALALAMSVLWWRGLPTAMRPDAERQSLLSDKSRLAAFTNEAREHLRADLAAMEARSRDAAPLVRSPWRIEAVPPDAQGSPHLRYTAGAPVRWSEITALVQQLGTTGRVMSLDIRSSGDLSRREIASAEIVVRRAPRPRRQARARPPRSECGRPRPAGGPIRTRATRTST